MIYGLSRGTGDDALFVAKVYGLSPRIVRSTPEGWTVVEIDNDDMILAVDWLTGPRDEPGSLLFYSYRPNPDEIYRIILAGAKAKVTLDKIRNRKKPT